MPRLWRDSLFRVFLGRKMAGRVARLQDSRAWPLHLDYAKPGRGFHGRTRTSLPLASPQNIPGLVIVPPLLSS
jgi:hypothetical protein